jgi:KUP system potassium uptake protein
MPSSSPGDAGGHPPPQRLSRVALAALGVVYGDIGTSPLYAIRECFGAPHGVAVTPDNVLGILSLVFWSLTLVVAVKYLSVVMRADNHGEGGILALFALALPAGRALPGGAVLAGLFGAALLFGEGVITPAISVLSAVEGLEVATHALAPAVIPLTVGILVALFVVQRFGTGGIGSVFGPAILVWFLAIAAAGLPAIARTPGVLAALGPHHAIGFFAASGAHGFFILGAVVLVVTGSEALYADMGHFGRRPIRIAWYGVVMPCLLLNYFGQGALLLERGAAAAANPFYGLTPGWTLYPMVAIATVAAVIASQALISGTFSLVRQAVQLGYLPRVRIVHTSGRAEGQIYVPSANAALMVACLLLVVTFRSSSALAAAYGIAVTGAMTITSLLLYRVARGRWEWPRWRAGGLVALFLAVDLAFLLANANKLAHGGWVPLAIGAVLFTVMTTWRRGRSELAERFYSRTLPIEMFLEDLERTQPLRVPGTAVFMTLSPQGVPPPLLHHFKHNKTLHEQVVLLSVLTERVPLVPHGERTSLQVLGQGFFRVVARYGFMEEPNINEVMKLVRKAGVDMDLAAISYFLGRETLLTTGRTPMAQWRKSIFAFLSRNATPATTWFGIPPNRVIELGVQVEL